MNKKQREEYERIRKERWEHINRLRSKVEEHLNHKNCQIAVDMLLDHDYYESGTICGISPTRAGFDNLHENYCDLYRGGFREIKVGDLYVIYGFEFD
jgi:hypothetical protein